MKPTESKANAQKWINELQSEGTIPKSNIKKSSIISINEEKINTPTKSKPYTLSKNKKISNDPGNKDLSDGLKPFDDNTNWDCAMNLKNITKKEYFNKLGLKRINFQFDEYGRYPDETFQPSMYFFKFLAMKPDLVRENMSKGKKCPPKLRWYVPDTIVLNDTEGNYWVYTDTEGYVNRIEESDLDVMEKFKSPEKDENELIGVSKTPMIKESRIDENRLDLLNLDELEKCLFSKSGSQMEIQRFVKCRGPKAFVCRSVWRRDKPPYIYILTNKANYHDNIKNQNWKFVVNSKDPKSYFAFFSTSGKHLEETNYYMNNIVKFIEGHSDILIDEIAGDFVKDEAGIWWFINTKALKISNISKFKGPEGEYISLPFLDFFVNRRSTGDYHHGITRKFDYQTKIKCKFCGINYSKKNLKYKLTTKMILETDKMLGHVDFEKNKFNCIDRPDLKHNDYSMIYLPFRVCEDCYLLFETLDDIKNYQIKIANWFKNPVNEVSFGFGYYTKEKPKGKGVELSKEEIKRIQERDYCDSEDSEGNNESYVSESNQDKDSQSINQKDNNLYRILIMFNDLLWSEKIKIPKEELYLWFTFLGNSYKVPLKQKPYNQDWDYTIINFMKIFYIICPEPEGFIDYVEKNRQMEIKLGSFSMTEEETKKNDVKNLLKKQIVIEDPNIYDSKEKFVQFASVDLSLQGLKYGTNYRNMLNGWLFKRDEPHYVGKWRCLIRIHKVKPIKDWSKYTYHNHFNMLIPPVNFVVSEDLPDYWIELVERQKLRESCLDKIMDVMAKHNVKFEKEKHKKQVFQALETLVSTYSTKTL